MKRVDEISLEYFYNVYINRLHKKVKEIFDLVEEDVKFDPDDVVVYGDRVSVEKYKVERPEVYPLIDICSIYETLLTNEREKFIFLYHILKCCFYSLTDEFDMKMKQILVSKINIYEEILNTDSVTIIRSLYYDREDRSSSIIDSFMNKENLTHAVEKIKEVCKDPSAFGLDGLGLESIMGGD